MFKQVCLIFSWQLEKIRSIFLGLVAWDDLQEQAHEELRARLNYALRTNWAIMKERIIADSSILLGSITIAADLINWLYRRKKENLQVSQNWLAIVMKTWEIPAKNKQVPEGLRPAENYLCICVRFGKYLCPPLFQEIDSACKTVILNFCFGTISNSIYVFQSQTRDTTTLSAKQTISVCAKKMLFGFGVCLALLAELVHLVRPERV